MLHLQNVTTVDNQLFILRWLITDHECVKHNFLFIRVQTPTIITWVTLSSTKLMSHAPTKGFYFTSHNMPSFNHGKIMKI